MAFPTAYEDSDADDEYERSVVSPPLVTDSETSPTDSDPPSTENTPTLYGHMGDDKSPRNLISDWSTEECADYVSSLGLSQYADAFLDNEIVGEALIALKHDELKELGMNSVGHRLTLLKSVYDIKIKQDVPIDAEHYVPLSADTGMQDAVATQEDIARIIQSIKIRDERIVQAEQELHRVSEEYRRLREELLPLFRIVKDKSQPLPIHPPELEIHEQLGMHMREKQGLSRKYSHKQLMLGSTPKNASPTHVPPSIQEGKAYGEGPGIDPSPAALAASSHLNATMNNTSGSQPSTSPGQPPLNIPSPTSPPSYTDALSQSPIIPRSNQQQQPPPSSSRSNFSGSTDDTLLPTSSYPQIESRHHPMPMPLAPRGRVKAPDGAGREGGGGGGASGGAAGGNTIRPPEVFKSFRVSMEDPCYKVLPAALKQYDISGDWKQYALYIVYGDEERCLELDEKPLILFKQLDREGRKPMFMLRKMAEGHNAAGGGGPGGGGQPGSAGLVLPGSGGSTRGATLPGGVL
ncbi:MAG: AAA ATPase cdc48 [Watsoniomyces obsoletus]|nr:MAG: AAA ATPase cdc48 [Watsoniomyces obsoletus]